MSLLVSGAQRQGLGPVAASEILPFFFDIPLQPCGPLLLPVLTDANALHELHVVFLAFLLVHGAFLPRDRPLQALER